MADPHCKKCKLHKTCKTVCVPADVPVGKGKKDILLIGEAPGQEEDIQGKPFVGKPGEALRQVLGQLGLTQRTIITNAVKCRPPNNETPSLDFIRRCRPYLEAELAEWKPRYVVLCGLSAAKSFLGERTLRMAELRGRKNWIEPISGADIIATYHPAAALRDPKRWYDIVDDLRRIDSREFIDPQTVQVSRKPRRLPAALSFDLETMGLNPWDERCNIICVGWSSKVDRASVTRDPSWFVQQLREKPRLLVGHNIKFDLNWLRAKHGYIHEGEVWDTMVALHLLDENAPAKSLKYAAHQLTGLGDYDAAVKPLLTFNGDWSVDETHVTRTNSAGASVSLPREQVEEYCGWDASATWEIYLTLKREIEKAGLNTLMAAEMRVLLALHEMECNGIEVDPGKVAGLKRKYQSRRTVLRKAILKSLGPIPDDFSLDSPRKLGELLFDTLGLPVQGRTPTGAPQVGEAALQALSSDPTYGKAIEKILEYRNCGKMISTYLDNMLDMRDGNNLVHASYKLAGTVTGRLSCSDPNLQNIPRDANAPVKEVFIGGQGKVLIQADYSQIELRIGALLAGDPRMLQAIRAGEDIHSTTARSLFGESFTKEQRSLAKTINFGIFYGAGPTRIAAEGSISFREAQALIRNWFDTYPGVKEWVRGQHETLAEKGYVEDLFGRRRRLPVEVTTDRGEYAALMRQAANMPVQGSAAQLTKLALSSLSRRFRGPTRPSRLVGSVHDSILVTCPTRLESSVINVVRETMEGATALCREHGFKLDIKVPTPVEIKAGPSWAGE